MFWQPIAAGVVTRLYARDLSRGIDKNLNLYTEYRMMVAIGGTKLGHRVGMPSAAAAVLDAMTEYNSFLGVFAVGDLFYLIAVRNGIILQDKLFESSDDARNEYFKLSEIPDWNALFAPGAWGMPRAVERNLADLVNGNTNTILHTISRVRVGVLSAVALVVFGAIMLHIFREPIAEMLTPIPQVGKINPELAAEYKRQIEEKNKELDAQFEIEKPRPPEPIVLPYEFLPNVEQRANVCYQAIAFLMQPVSGWNQYFVTCDQTHASVQMRRDFGTLGDFYQIATELMPGAFVTEQNEDNLMVRVALPDVALVASQDERDAETVLRDVQTIFQSIDTPIQAEIVMDMLSNGVDTVYLSVVEIAAESKMVPMQFMKIFEDFGGVYMTKCTWNVTSRMWNYEVIIYAK